MTPLVERRRVPMAEIIAAARDYELATGVRCSVVAPDGGLLYPVKKRDYPCWMCLLSRGPMPDAAAVGTEHVQRGQQAEPFRPQNIYVCDSNLLHWAIPVRRSGRLAALLVGGPARSDSGDGSFATDVLERLARRSAKLARVQEASLRAMYEQYPVMDTERVEALARTLQKTAMAVSDPDEGGGHDRLARESRINEYIQELKVYRSQHDLQEGIPTYPLDKEQQLLQAISAGDGDTAQAVLNELLGHVFMTLGADLERIKIRAREIVVLLSRIVLARGADSNRVFGFNYRVLDELDGLEDLNDVAHWMARIVRGFAGSVLRVPSGAAHTMLLRKVIDYVDESYRGRVRLSRAAEIGGVSAPYLSRLFRQEMGETFSQYVRRIRVQRAEDLLIGTRLSVSDIADLTGFSDQSHLTAAFRSANGTTPARFRKQK